MPLKRGDKWVARVKRNGKQYWLGTFPTKQGALRAEVNWVGEKDEGGETIGAFGERWLRDFPPPTESTKISYTERVSKFVEEFANVPMCEFSQQDAISWAGKAKNRTRVLVLRTMFAQAVQLGVVTVNPFTNVSAGPMNKRKRVDRSKVISEDDLAHLMNVAEGVKLYGPTFRAMIGVAGYVGCRPGELFNIARSDIKGNFLTITEQWNSKVGKRTPPKNHQPRQVVFPPQAANALLGVELSDEPPMFRAPRGGVWSASMWNHNWAKIRVAAGFPTLPFRDLRKFCATWLWDQGCAPEQIAIQLGHRDGGALVRSTYGDPDETRLLAGVLKAFENGVANPTERPSLRVA